MERVFWNRFVIDFCLCGTHADQALLLEKSRHTMNKICVPIGSRQFDYVCILINNIDIRSQ